MLGILDSRPISNNWWQKGHPMPPSTFRRMLSYRQDNWQLLQQWGIDVERFVTGPNRIVLRFSDTGSILRANIGAIVSIGSETFCPVFATSDEEGLVAVDPRGFNEWEPWVSFIAIVLWRS